jgi:hypothetical protein
MAKIAGVVLYRGRSRLNGDPIFVVATFQSKNDKTGDMIQTWILQESIDPVLSVKNGWDFSVCGTCRFKSGNGCYVNHGQAPLSVWAGYHRGIYPDYDPEIHGELFKGRRLRIGSYGDPSAVPVESFSQLLPLVEGHTGYTHQWRTISDYRGILQASCDNASDAAEAISLGWKCFTVVESYADTSAPGVICVNETHKKTCLECKLCNGSKSNIVIQAHGPKGKLSKARLALQTI